MIHIDRAPPYLTIQDAGRPGYRASGVPHCGAMDQWALELGNLLVANRRDAAAFEWAIGGGALRFDEDSIIALTGAEVEAAINDVPVSSQTPIEVRGGQLLTINRIVARRFVYVAVRGGLDCPPILGSRSTYLPAAFGGVEGRRLKTGDHLTIGAVSPDSSEIQTSMSAEGPDYDAEVIRAIPRSRGFSESFLGTTFTVSPASDRMGYRLEGDNVLESEDASITSEPVCAGAIQLTPNGHAIVLMADSPTIGGYRILGTVITSDLPIVAQSIPGREFRFATTTVEAAQDELRRREKSLARENRSALEID